MRGWAAVFLFLSGWGARAALGRFTEGEVDWAIGLTICTIVCAIAGFRALLERQ